MSNQTTDEQVSSQSEEKKEEKKKSPLVIVIIVAAIVICVLVGVIVYLLNRSDAEPEVVHDNVITPDNVEEVVNQMEAEEKVPVGSYEVSMNLDWVFPDGNTASTNAFVENSTANTNTVYFTLTKKDGGEQIYRSPYLTVGSHIENFKLDTALAKGTYDVIITYHLVDDDFNELRSVSMYMTITVEN